MLRRRLVEDYLLRVGEEIERREYIEREVKPSPREGRVTAIVGPRRSGKTTLMKIMAQKTGEHFLIDFEHIAFASMEPHEIFDLISIYGEIFGREPKLLFLDEVQELPQWPKVVRSLLQSGFIPIISGSSSKLMSREIGTQLRGRTDSYILLPFSFKEYLRAKGIEVREILKIEEEGKIRGALREYLFTSSFPEVVLTGDEGILMDYFDSILYRDFVERYGLRSVELARFIFVFLLQNFAGEFSVRKIINFLASQGLRFGKETVYRYVEKIPETLSVFFVEKMEESPYKRLWPRKVFICDLGLAKVVSSSEDIGRRMENLVFLHLYRKKNEDPLLDIRYFRDREGREVDLVLRRGTRTVDAIQVTYASARDEIPKREVESLIRFSERFPTEKLTVITWDYEDREERNGKLVRFVPLWKFLLEEAG